MCWRFLALVLFGALGMSADSSFADGKSELEKACWPQTWQKDVAAAKLAECQRFADSVPEDDPLRIGALDRQVTMLIAVGRSDEALPLVNAFLEKQPDATDIRLRRIELLNGTPDAGRMLDDLEYLHQHAPNDPRFWAKYGNYQRMVGSNADALQSFTTGLSLDPRNLDLLQGRAYAYGRMGRPCRS